MSKKLEVLEKALDDMKRFHRASWDMYGSELCTGDMIRQEEELEKKIAKLKQKEDKEIPFHTEDPRQIVDD